MNKHIYPLLIAQFLSALADNAILFTVIAIVMDSHNDSWYIPAVQSAFTLSYVVLAPWVGELADTHIKSHILFIANIIKALGAICLLVNIEPIIAYCIVGVGAAIYNPVKYGILPELAEHHYLIKANSLMEGSTILAILLGMLLGAKAADYSIPFALIGCLSLFLISAFVTTFLPKGTIKPVTKHSKISAFCTEIKAIFTINGATFTILGGGLFWLTAATLRVILIVWAPLILLMKNATEIAELTFFLAIGIIIGSAIVPKLIPLEKIARTRLAAYLMAIFIIMLSLTHDLWSSRGILLLIGMAGGIFIVPINAQLQEIGQKSFGSGRAVALQGFFNNVAMLMGVGCYSFITSKGVDPVMAMLLLGFFVIIGTLLISLSLPKHPTSTLAKR